MDVIAGGAWYAVCVRRVTDVDRAAAGLVDLVLRRVLSAAMTGGGVRTHGIRRRTHACCAAFSGVAFIERALGKWPSRP
jgi:hypothetical protein